jgi:hypothetical protein
MANRAQDWLAKVRHDIDHARHAIDAGDCFAAKQRAEKTSLEEGCGVAAAARRGGIRLA